MSLYLLSLKIAAGKINVMLNNSNKNANKIAIKNLDTFNCHSHYKLKAIKHLNDDTSVFHVSLLKKRIV